MSDEEQRTFDHLVSVIAEELSAKRAGGRRSNLRRRQPVTAGATARFI